MEDGTGDWVKERAKRAAERYAVKLTLGVGAGRRDGDYKAQAEHFALAVARTTRLRADTAAVMDTIGVHTIVRPFYYSFAMRLDKLTREQWSEHSLWTEAHILVTTWVSRGLSREVLLAIARDLFNLNLAESEPPACATGTEAVVSNRG